MTDHAVVQGLAAGVGGAVLSLLGVDAPTLTAGLIGCVFGASFGPSVGRWHSACLFVAAVCAASVAASVLGPLLAGWLPSLSIAAASKGAALMVGVLLHPIIQGASVVTPGLIKSAAKRFGGTA